MPTKIFFGQKDKLIVTDSPSEVTKKLSEGWAELERVKGGSVTVNADRVQFLQDAPGAGAPEGGAEGK